MGNLTTLKAQTFVWFACALAIGIMSTLIWRNSNAAWDHYLDNSYQAGYELYWSLTQDEPAPAGVQLETLDNLPTAQKVIYPTVVSILSHQSPPIQSTRLQLTIHSSDLKYPIAKLDQDTNDTPAQQLGNVVRFLASYCSDPILYTQRADQTWLRVDGTKIWSCDAAPSDFRLLAAAILLIGTAIVVVQIDANTAMLARFSSALRKQSHFNGRHTFEPHGPKELREIIETVNDYFELEREKLTKRAMVMSGVSHDLGTPATRLRLRTALIEDKELRERLEGDIDQMTSMIEGVLTYTRSEIDSEETHQVSLTSLVESIVADYADVGRPVTFEQASYQEIEATRSVFNARAHTTLTPAEDARRVLAHVRPMSMRRAITNLIDNALKYGRRATVSISTTSTTATILIEDEGNALSVAQLNALTAPFLRGENANYIEGTGLGLTIVSTIAKQHRGTLRFEKTSIGVRAKLTVRRLNQ